MKILTIKLAAPLQSYGNEATFERRTTAHYPTKSAVIGMVAAALGYRRTDPRILALNKLSFAVRIDQAGTVLTDYQTVEWKKNTRKITYREYLQDAKFMVALGSEDAQFVEQIKSALTHPKFPLFLGRRSNAPAGVLRVSLLEAKSPVAVLKKIAWEATDRYQRQWQRETIEIVADANLMPDKRSALVKDQVQSFDQRNRRYGFRAFARTNVRLVDLDQHAQVEGTQHDIMDKI